MPRRHLTGWLAVALLTVALLAACSGGSPGRAGPSGNRQSGQRSGPPRAAASAGPAAADPGPMALQVRPAPFQLPAGISGAVSLASGADLMIVGGSTRARPALRSVLALDPVSGATRPAGQLAAPVTGSAAAMLAGRPVIFGGTASTGAPTVQAMPTARTASWRQPGPRGRASRAGPGRQAPRAQPGRTVVTAAHRSSVRCLRRGPGSPRSPSGGPLTCSADATRAAFPPGYSPPGTAGNSAPWRGCPCRLVMPPRPRSAAGSGYLAAVPQPGRPT